MASLDVILILFLALFYSLVRISLATLDGAK